MVSKGTKTLSRRGGGVGFGGEGTEGKAADEDEPTLTGRVEGLGSIPNDKRLSAVGLLPAAAQVQVSLAEERRFVSASAAASGSVVTLDQVSPTHLAPLPALLPSYLLLQGDSLEVMNQQLAW